MELQKLSTCEWTTDYDDADDVGERSYGTQCGRIFDLLGDDPAEKAFKYCPYCGGVLTVQPTLKQKIETIIHDIITDSKKDCGIEVDYYVNRFYELFQSAE